MPPVNILITVDSITALSTGALTENIYLTDDNPYSQDKGTGHLKTNCVRGQTITWKALAVDVQSPAVIADIAFIDDIGVTIESGVDPAPESYVKPRWLTWSGIIPYRLNPGIYHYRLAIQVASGERSTMFTTSPALIVAA
jgi:hypothetical protein